MAQPRAGNSVHFQWHGMDEFIDDLQQVEDTFKRFVMDGMDEYSLIVEEGARALAFRYGGDLEESILSAAVAYRNGVVIGAVGTNLVYAWRLHEKPHGNKIGTLYDNGIRIQGYYIGGRGKRTRDKASWKGQMPGRKFIERAVVATEDEFYEIMEEVYEKALLQLGGS